MFDGNHDDNHFYGDWCKEIHLKCSTVIAIATAPQVYQAYTEALSTSTVSSTPSQYADTDDDATLYILKNFLDSLISLLWDMLRRHPVSRTKDQLKLLYERLRFCRALLKQQQRSVGWEIRGQIGVLIHSAGMLVCSLHHAHVEISYPEQLSELLERFGVLQVQVEIRASESSTPTTDELGPCDSALIMEDNLISDGNEETAMLSHQPQRSRSPPQVAGFQDDEVISILDRLTRGSKQLQIVPICGMPGLGKTTFASAVFNHRLVIYHFQACAWCTISHVLDKKRVVLQLLNQLIPESGSFSEMTEDDLANKLRQSLKRKRYLIVLDDVWTTEAWQSLAASFPDDSTQSRLILTSRHHKIVPHALHSQQPYLLRLREDNECLEILQRQLSHEKGWTSELGMTVAKMCKGLPLTVVVVAGLLRTMKQQGWKEILDHLNSSGISGEMQCNNVLELSFKHLPNDLKHCFLYFAAFPEDEEISVKRLLRLWTAEGIVRPNELKRLEDVSRGYMEKLIQRSLLMVVRNRSIGGVKTCRIHDLIHDFCQKKAKQENFFHILSQRDDELLDFIEPCYLQRLSIHSDPIHFKEAKLYCPGAHSILFSTTQANDVSYLFDMLFIIQIFKLLHTLDISKIPLIAGIPSEIELLTRLRYLSICSKLGVIPSSLGKLPNLETLIGEFWSFEVMSFPHTLWDLHKIKWLHITTACLDGFTLPIENLENSSSLLELETLCGLVFYSYSSIEQQLRKFPNIRRLKCSILPGAESASSNSNKIVIPDFLNQLECLSISGIGSLLCEFGSSENLRRLSLRDFELSRENIADIGKLPNLEVLKLHLIGFQGDTLDMKEGELSKLRYLKMFYMRIKRWTVSDEQLPCLKKLLLHGCDVSEELPSDCLTTSATLEEIEVFFCSRNVEDLAREIQEVQKDYGNFVKVRIEPAGNQLRD